LFPAPLHLTRQVSDPFSGKTEVLDEYGYGNRLASVRGARTTIADYEKGELTEIDRQAGTYSVTRFDAVAKARHSVEVRKSADSTSGSGRSATQHSMRALGVKQTKGGRQAEFYTTDLPITGLKRTLEVGFDRNVTVTKDALEALLGSAYPGSRNSEQDAVLSTATSSRRGGLTAQEATTGSDEMVALPVEQIEHYEADGVQVEFRTTVVRVANEAPPSDVLAIPAGARLVTSRIVEVGREVDEFDHPTPPARKQ
jgi:hypothetical protein